MIKLTTGEISEAVADYFACDTGSFDEWMKSHDAEVRNEAIIARDTRTPAELIQAAFEAAHPVPDGRNVPPGVAIIARWDDGDISFHAMGRAPGTSVPNDHVEVRTLEPLPPVIPDDCDLVMARREGDVRRPWTRHSNPSWHRTWFSVTSAGKAISTAESFLIDPKPVPEEES